MSPAVCLRVWLAAGDVLGAKHLVGNHEHTDQELLEVNVCRLSGDTRLGFGRRDNPGRGLYKNAGHLRLGQLQSARNRS